MESKWPLIGSCECLCCLSGACFILAVCVCQASHQTCHLTAGLFPSDGLGDVEQQLSESDDEASPLPVTPGANLRPGIVHRLDKGTTGIYLWHQVVCHRYTFDATTYHLTLGLSVRLVDSHDDNHK